MSSWRLRVQESETAQYGNAHGHAPAGMEKTKHPTLLGDLVPIVKPIGIRVNRMKPIISWRRLTKPGVGNRLVLFTDRWEVCIDAKSQKYARALDAGGSHAAVVRAEFRRYHW